MRTSKKASTLTTPIAEISTPGLTRLQHSEQVGSPLYFVDQDTAVEPFQGRHRFLKVGKVRGILQIEETVGTGGYPWHAFA